MINDFKILFYKIKYGQFHWIDIWYYLSGSFWHYIYQKLGPRYILKSVWKRRLKRLSTIDKTCLYSNECQRCGCTVDKMLFSSKSCCYDEHKDIPRCYNNG